VAQASYGQTDTRAGQESRGPDELQFWDSRIPERNFEAASVARDRGRRACAPSRMTSPSFWIASLLKTRATNPPALASDARSAVGRHGNTTAGRVAAAIYGTRSTLGEFAPPVFTSGLQHSASRAPGGRRIRIGTSNDQISTGSVCPRTNPQELVILAQSRNSDLVILMTVAD
jgi:hypothetical protein